VGRLTPHSPAILNAAVESNSRLMGNCSKKRFWAGSVRVLAIPGVSMVARMECL